MVSHEMSDTDEDRPATAEPSISYKSLKRNKIKDSLLTLEDLGPENEIWILKAPSDVRNINFIQLSATYLQICYRSTWSIFFKANYLFQRKKVDYFESKKDFIQPKPLKTHPL
jgi:hypothetical protein